MGNCMYGSDLAKSIRSRLQEEIKEYKKKGYRIPTLAIVVVGHDDGSHSYVLSIQKSCANLGIQANIYAFEESVSQEEVTRTIQQLNADATIDGIIIQMPLPKHLDTQTIIECMDSSKDVDGLTSKNVASLYMKQKGIVPCTPKAVMRMLEAYNVDLCGKEIVVVGRSHSVGRPVAQLLINEHATVTICHSKTNNLAEVCKRADILVVAIGRSRYIKADCIKNGAVVIDVGVNVDDNGRLCGDVDYEQVIDVASLVTPVPKGVGPVTTTMLLENVVESYKGRV